jgi:hypothetical protein
LSEAELAFVTSQLEGHAPPDIVEARAATEKLVDELNRGYRAAIAKISSRSGFQKELDGSRAMADA